MLKLLNLVLAKFMHIKLSAIAAPLNDLIQKEMPHTFGQLLVLKTQ